MPNSCGCQHSPDQHGIRLLALGTALDTALGTTKNSLGTWWWLAGWRLLLVPCGIAAGSSPWQTSQSLVLVPGRRAASYLLLVAVLLPLATLRGHED